MLGTHAPELERDEMTKVNNSGSGQIGADGLLPISNRK